MNIIGYPMFDDLPSSVNCLDKRLKVLNSKSYFGGLGLVHNTSDPYSNLFDALMDFLPRNNYALLISNLHTIAIVKRNETYMVFDSHPRSANGRADANGKAIALFYEDATKLHKGVLDLIYSTGATCSSAFELIPLEVMNDNVVPENNSSIQKSTLTKRTPNESTTTDINGNKKPNHQEIYNKYQQNYSRKRQRNIKRNAERRQTYKKKKISLTDLDTHSSRYDMDFVPQSSEKVTMEQCESRNQYSKIQEKEDPNSEQCDLNKIQYSRSTKTTNIINSNAQSFIESTNKLCEPNENVSTTKKAVKQQKHTRKSIVNFDFEACNNLGVKQQSIDDNNNKCVTKSTKKVPSTKTSLNRLCESNVNVRTTKEAVKQQKHTRKSIVNVDFRACNNLGEIQQSLDNDTNNKCITQSTINVPSTKVMKYKKRRLVNVSETKDSSETKPTIAECMTLQNKRSVNIEFDSCLTRFFNDIRNGPIYPCACCTRFMYKTSVVIFKENRDQIIDPDLISKCIPFESDNTRQYICRTCDSSIKKSKVPAQALANRLEVEPIPIELSLLCHLETQLICQILPFMKIVSLPTRSQRGLRGHVVLVPSNVNQTVSCLPRPSSESQIIALGLKRRLNDNHCVIKQFIRPVLVNKAIDYLKMHNERYSNVIINDKWETQSKLDNPYFWDTVVKTIDTQQCMDELN